MGWAAVLVGNGFQVCGPAGCAQDAELRDHLIAAVEMASLEPHPFGHIYMEGLIQAARGRIPTASTRS
jgi:hypothetical protein